MEQLKRTLRVAPCVRCLPDRAEQIRAIEGGCGFPVVSFRMVDRLADFRLLAPMHLSCTSAWFVLHFSFTLSLWPDCPGSWVVAVSSRRGPLVPPTGDALLPARGALRGMAPSCRGDNDQLLG